MISAEDDVMPSISSSYSSTMPNNDNNDNSNNYNRPTPTFFLTWPTKPEIPLFNLFGTKGLLFWSEKKTMLYFADNSSKKTEKQQQQPVRTEPSLTQSASPTTTISVTVMPSSHNEPTKTWPISTSHQGVPVLYSTWCVLTTPINHLTLQTAGDLAKTI